MPAFILPSFAKGEISPALYGRVDAALYQISLRTARNVIIHPSGGVSNRPGTLVVGPVARIGHTVSTTIIRDFQFRTSDQYVLEFGNLYMRVIRNDAHVVNAAVTITGATAADPVVITAAAHGITNGQEVFITGVVGMTQLNGNRYIAQQVTTNTLELTHQVTGLNINGAAFTAYTSGGTVATIFELVTPYLAADLSTLKMVQSGDIMTITHPTYAPRDLARTDHNAWTLTINTFAPGQADPTGISVTRVGAAGSTVHRYRVTAIRQEEDIFEESLPGLSTTTQTITGATAANPVVLTVTAHPYANGDEIEVNSIVGMTELNGRRFFVANQAANTVELEGEDGTGHTAYSSGGTANATFVEVTDSETVANTSLSNFNRVAFTAATDANRYAIYRRESGRYRWIAEIDAPLVSFDDVTTRTVAAGAIHQTDNAIGPPRARNPFLGTGNFPTASSYYQQRQIYGGTVNNSGTTFYSQTGNRLNMSNSTPAQADDAMTVSLNARQVHEIRHFVPGNDLIILTSGGEWRVNAGDNSGFSIDTIKQKPQSEWGAAHHRPIVAGSIVLFVEEGNARVRSLGYSLEIDGYTGTDLTLLSNHLLTEDGPNEFIISDWSYQSVPEGRLYLVRSDGMLLTMTFNQSQEVIAWTTWETDGFFEATTSLRRSLSAVEDGVYFIVNRTLNGQQTRYIERLATRKFADVEDAYFVDCGYTLDSPLAITGVSQANPVVVTAIAHGFSNEDDVDIVGIEWINTLDKFRNKVLPDQLNGHRFTAISVATDTFELVDSDGVIITAATVANPVVITSVNHGRSDGDRVYISGVQGMTQLNSTVFSVNNKTDDTFELGDASTSVSVDGTGFGTWTGGGTAKLRIDGSAYSLYVRNGEARRVVTTITGLEVLEGESLTGLLDGSPLADNLTVALATVTLPVPASRVHLGLPYSSDIETLNVEAAEGTIQGRIMRIHKVVIRYKKSRIPWIGPNAFDMTEPKQRTDELMGSPTKLLTDDDKVTIPPEWNSNGRLFMRQQEPLPFTILAIIPDLRTEDMGDD